MDKEYIYIYPRVCVRVLIRFDLSTTASATDWPSADDIPPIPEAPNCASRWSSKSRGVQARRGTCSSVADGLNHQNMVLKCSKHV